jgi:hypothetical protein
MLKVVALLFSLFLIVSCSKGKEHIIPEANNIPSDTLITSPPDTTVKSYLALGDSYTIGQSVSVSERFPPQSVGILRNKNVSISDPDIIAFTSWTTENLLSLLMTQPPSHSYSCVSLLIGVNNQYQGRSLDEYKTQFSALLNRDLLWRQ